MENRTLLSPYCAKLKSKKGYFLEKPPLTREDILDGSERCWCQLTMDAIGPDGALVDPDVCGVRRGCFVPYGPKA